VSYTSIASIRDTSKEFSSSRKSIAPTHEPRENDNIFRAIRVKHSGHLMAVLKRDTHYHTYADYLVWSNTYGDELINGTAYVREPPSPARLHQEIVVELCHQIRTALKDSPCRVYVAPFDVRLPKSTEGDDQVDTVVQPDVLIVSDLRKLDARGMRGAPDWLAEVLSLGTARHDQIIKLPVYERAGVREVWLINPIDLTVRIYRAALGRAAPGRAAPDQLKGGYYGRATVLELKGETPLTAVPGVTINWERVLARMS
jgi:Uma2 family endonuclease